MTTTAVSTETRTEAMRRLLQVARESGVRLGVAHDGDFYATSVSEPGRLYLVTPESCGCKGFESYRRCRHVAALWSHLGYFDGPSIDPEPTTVTIVELTPARETCTTCLGSGWEYITLRIRNRYVDSAVRCTTCEGCGAVAA